jgi:hypothetical protein
MKFETRHLVSYQETIFFTFPAFLEYLVAGLAARATGKAKDAAGYSFALGEKVRLRASFTFPNKLRELF